MLEYWGTLLSSYPHSLLLIGGTFLTTTLLTALLYKAAIARHLLPSIRERDVHTVRKPRVGGVAMWLAIVLSFIVLLVTKQPAAILSFGRAEFWGIDLALWGIMAGMTVILVGGLFDDFKSLPWPVQLGCQFLAALLLALSGVVIPFIRLPFDMVIQLSPFVSVLFTIFWTMLMINVMNWFDGLDGLAGSITVTACTALFLVSLQVGVIGTASLSLIVGSAAAGFLVWNWYPSKLFMGTVGSQLLGFLLAAIAIVTGGKLATAVLVLGIPVLDAVIVVARRLLAKKSPFIADQRHLHHRLLKIGLPVPWVVVTINIVALIFGGLAIYRPQTSTKGILTLVLFILMIGFILITYLLELISKKKVN